SARIVSARFATSVRSFTTCRRSAVSATFEALQFCFQLLDLLSEVAHFDAAEGVIECGHGSADLIRPFLRGQVPAQRPHSLAGQSLQPADGALDGLTASV